MSPTTHPSTIYLTPEEDARLRKNFKDKLQKYRELTGQPRVPSDPQSLRSQVIYADLMSDIAGPKAEKNGQDSIVAYAVGNPYPPCIVLVEDLKPMRMDELRMDTHHRGRVLTVRRVTPVVKLQVFSWTVVQDEDPSGEGTMERLEVLLHKSMHGQDVLESGDVFKVKEPYFTISDQGEPTLRVGHPSDLVICSSTEGGGDSESAEKVAAKTARDYKEEGSAALKQRNIPLAHKKYTKGLEIVGAAKEEIAYDLHRNRAHVNLLLHRLDEAKSDALASLTGLPDQKYKELDSKAYLRAGTAAYQSRDFQSAKTYFEEQARLSPGDNEAKARIRKTQLRITEQENGSYDFKKLKASLLLSTTRGGTSVEAASFTRNVEMKVSLDPGRGLFATRSFVAGEVVMCEKSFCVVWANEDEALNAMTYDFRDDRIRVFPAGLCKAVVQKLLDNPSQVGRVMDLYGDYRSPNVEQQRVGEGGGAVIDVFQVHDIVARNAFGPDSSTSSGLWVLASYINHSCLPNLEKEYVGDLIVLRAKKQIASGEELTHAYDLTSDYDARMEALMRTWGFKCGCKLCVAEKGDSEDMRKRRRELELEADALIEKRDVGRLGVVKARKLLRDIEGTFDEKRYKGLPKTALTRLQKRIGEVGKR